MNYNKLIPLIFFSLVFCQFNNIEVSIDLNRISHSDRQMFENFNYNIKNYLQNNNFCPECENMNIDIKCHFSIQTIQTSGSTKLVYSNIFISNNKDHYFYSKDLVFPYKKNKSLVFNPYSTNSLSAILNYYSYFFIGLELDIWGLELGTAYLNKVNEIADNLIYSTYSKGWEDRKENIKDLKLNHDYRNLRYIFYNLIHIIDFNNFTKEQKDKIILLYQKLASIHKQYGYEKNTMKLIQSYPDQFAKIFSIINFTDGIKLLIIFDEKNKNIYEKYLQ